MYAMKGSIPELIPAQKRLLKELMKEPQRKWVLMIPHRAGRATFLQALEKAVKEATKEQRQ